MLTVARRRVLSQPEDAQLADAVELVEASEVPPEFVAYEWPKEHLRGEKCEKDRSWS